MEKALFTEVPIFQGGMGVGVSLGGLAGAVAAQGGAGTISAAQIGFREPDFASSPLAANLRAMGKEVDRARQISGGRGAVGINIMVAMQHYGEYVKEAIRQKVDFIVSGAGLPMDLPELLKGTGVKKIPVVSSVKAARVICRRWWSKYTALPDAVVVEGPLAGGHLGFDGETAKEAAREAAADGGMDCAPMKIWFTSRSWVPMAFRWPAALSPPGSAMPTSDLSRPMWTAAEKTL